MAIEGRVTAVSIFTMSHRITALTLQKRDRQRVNVFLDGEFAFGLSRIIAAWLQVGQELSDEKIAELQQQDSREYAYQQALKFINFRARSEAELRRYLVKRGVSQEFVDSTVDRLRSSGLVDDTNFARSWVENRNEFKPRSKRALAFELRIHGIGDELIEQALEDQDDESLAYVAALKQSRKLKDLAWVDFRRKLAEFLARRGFTYDVIAPVVTRVWQELNSESPTGDL